MIISSGSCTFYTKRNIYMDIIPCFQSHIVFENIIQKNNANELTLYKSSIHILVFTAYHI